MNTTYILKSVSREELKEQTKRAKWAGGRHTWENLQYEVPTRSIYAYSNEQAAMADARGANKSRKGESVYFVQKLDLYNN